MHEHQPLVSTFPEALAYVVPVARILYASVFLLAVPVHFQMPTIDYAAEHGVPVAPIAVPVAGVIAFLGGLSVLLGFRARVGAWLLMVFLLPVTIYMHDFWHIADPMLMQMQQSNFLKNVALFGGALLISYYGAGPFSLDRSHEQEALHAHSVDAPAHDQPLGRPMG
jgi:putative oxidoreductase